MRGGVRVVYCPGGAMQILQITFFKNKTTVSVLPAIIRLASSAEALNRTLGGMRQVLLFEIRPPHQP